MAKSVIDPDLLAIRNGWRGLLRFVKRGIRPFTPGGVQGSALLSSFFFLQKRLLLFFNLCLAVVVRPVGTAR